MSRYIVLIAAAAVAFASIGGGSPAATPPPNGGTICIEPKIADGDYDPATRSFADAAAEAFAARGFTILDDPAHAAYVAELLLSRSEVGTSLAKVSGERAAEVVGVGVAIPLSTGKSDLVPLRRTRLELRIRKRGEKGVVWAGTAVTVRAAGARNGTAEMVASDLSAALLRSYPVEPPNVVGVP